MRVARPNVQGVRPSWIKDTGRQTKASIMPTVRFCGFVVGEVSVSAEKVMNKHNREVLPVNDFTIKYGAEKALVEKTDGTDFVLSAQPYDTFLQRAFIANAVPPNEFKALYVSQDLHRAIQKTFLNDPSLPGWCRDVPVKSLGELSIERAAGIHSRLSAWCDV